MSRKFAFAGRTALITGAASGIGAALAENLAARGCHLVLADINAAGLKRVADAVRRPGLDVACYQLDVADKAAVADFAGQVMKAHAPLHLLFNNAGVALGGTFDRVTEADFEWLMDINFYGVVRLTRALMPALQHADTAQIVNISSIFGVIAPPGQTAYCSAKFAVRGFSMALRHELMGSPIGVTTVHPGGVATSIATNARMPGDASNAEIADSLDRAQRSLVMPPPQAAEIIVSGVEKRKARIMVGKDAKAAALIERLFPVSYIHLLQRVLGAKKD
jgi:NADP-dependent 3-hydroxy acid dehydrogenase YdfG